MQTIPKLGVKGSVVEANAGWVRHVLFPRRKAVYATPENLEQFSLVRACWTKAMGGKRHAVASQVQVLILFRRDEYICISM